MADGRSFCGRERIIGLVDVESLQAACFVCNQFKSIILPEDFMDRIIKIFFYQTEKRCSKDVKLKVIYRLVNIMILVGTGGNFLPVPIVSDGKECYTIWQHADAGGAL